MTYSAIAVRDEVIEGKIIPESNREALSQHQESLFQDGGCEFNSDGEIIADWLQSKSQKTAKTYFSTIKQFHNFSDGIAIAQWTKKLILAYVQARKERDKVATVTKKLCCLKY